MRAPSADLEVLQDALKPILTGPLIRQVYIAHYVRPEEYIKEIITEWLFHNQDRLWQGRCGKYATCHQDRAIVQIYNLLGLYSRSG